jgi:hypothetical protein
MYHFLHPFRTLVLLYAWEINLCDEDFERLLVRHDYDLLAHAGELRQLQEPIRSFFISGPHITCAIGKRARRAQLDTASVQYCTNYNANASHTLVLSEVSWRSSGCRIAAISLTNHSIKVFSKRRPACWSVFTKIVYLTAERHCQPTHCGFWIFTTSDRPCPARA